MSPTQSISRSSTFPTFSPDLHSINFDRTYHNLDLFTCVLSLSPVIISASRDKYLLFFLNVCQTLNKCGLSMNEWSRKASWRSRPLRMSNSWKMTDWILLIRVHFKYMWTAQRGLVRIKSSSALWQKATLNNRNSAELEMVLTPVSSVRLGQFLLCPGKEGFVHEDLEVIWLTCQHCLVYILSVLRFFVLFVNSKAFSLD